VQGAYTDSSSFTFTSGGTQAYSSNGPTGTWSGNETEGDTLYEPGYPPDPSSESFATLNPGGLYTGPRQWRWGAGELYPWPTWGETQPWPSAQGTPPNVSGGQPLSDVTQVAPPSEVETPVCFAAGTLVLMADGTSKPIERIEPGEMVLAASEHDPEGPVKACRVLEAYHNGPRPLLEVRVAGGTIRCTFKHPFYVKGKGWTAAEELEAGDHLRAPTDRSPRVAGVSSSHTSEAVFNLHVEESRTYFVLSGAGGGGILVHNQSEPAPEEGREGTGPEESGPYEPPDFVEIMNRIREMTEEDEEQKEQTLLNRPGPTPAQEEAMRAEAAAEEDQFNQKLRQLADQAERDALDKEFPDALSYYSHNNPPPPPTQYVPSDPGSAYNPDNLTLDSGEIAGQEAAGIPSNRSGLISPMVEVTRTTPSALIASARAQYNLISGRALFLDQFASTDEAQAYFNEEELSLMREGTAPPGWLVHHIQPLFRGGDNSYDNLILVPEWWHLDNFFELHFYPIGQNPFGSN